MSRRLERYDEAGVLLRVQIGLCGLGLLVGATGGAFMARVATGWPHMLTLTGFLVVAAVALWVLSHATWRVITREARERGA